MTKAKLKPNQGQSEAVVSRPRQIQNFGPAATLALRTQHLHTISLTVVHSAL